MLDDSALPPEQPAGCVGFQCPACGRTHDARALGRTKGVLPECCRQVMNDIANAFSAAVLCQSLLLLSHRFKNNVFNDALADAAILSPNAEVRAAAVRYRNLKKR